MFNRTLSALAAIALTGAAAAIAAPAVAQDVEESVTVSYGDLDLASPAGAASLDRRLRNAARQVCGPRDVVIATSVLACEQRAIARARADLQVALNGKAGGLRIIATRN